MAVIASSKETKEKKPRKKSKAKGKSAPWRPSLETHAEDPKKKRKKKKGEAEEDDAEEEDLTHVAADTQSEEIIEVEEEEKEQEDDDEDDEEVDQPERDDKDDDDDDDAPAAGSATDKKKPKPKKRPDGSKQTSREKSDKGKKEATYRVVEVKGHRYSSREEGQLCDLCGDAAGVFHCVENATCWHVSLAFSLNTTASVAYHTWQVPCLRSCCQQS